MVSPAEDDYRRISETLRNRYGDNIHDEGDIDKALYSYMTGQSVFLDDKHKSEITFYIQMPTRIII